MAPKGSSRKKKGKRKQTDAARSGFSNKPFAKIRAKVPVRPGENKAATNSAHHDKPKQDNDDELLFSSAMAGVEPMTGRKEFTPPAPSIPTGPSPVEQEEQEVMDELRKLVDGQSRFSIHETDEAISGLAEGVDPQLLDRLKAGEFSIQDHLDLHGLSRQEARPRVEAFLSRALGHGMRCVLIIHGRGHRSKDKKPVLKPALKNWFLRSGLRKSILAFCTARVCDGGAGAIYVLLKKSRRP